jgi:hypothetical protein
LILKADFGSVERVALDVFLVLATFMNIIVDVTHAVWVKCLPRWDRDISIPQMKESHVNPMAESIVSEDNLVRTNKLNVDGDDAIELELSELKCTS